MSKLNLKAFQNMKLSGFKQSFEAAKAAPAIAGKKFEKLPVSKVYSGAQPRKVFENIDELALSLKTQGQFQPITVYPADKNGRYKVFQGERRLRAARQAGLETIEAIVLDAPEKKTSAQQFISQLVENVQRDNMRPMEIAEALGHLLDLGLTRKDIEVGLSKKSSWVQQYCSFATMPEWLKSMADQVPDVVALSQLVRAVRCDEKKTCELVTTYLTENPGATISRAEARAMVKRVLEDGEAADAQKKPAGTEDKVPPQGSPVEAPAAPVVKPAQAPATGKTAEKPAQPPKKAAEKVPAGFVKPVNGEPEIKVYWDDEHDTRHHGLLSLGLVSEEQGFTGVRLGSQLLLVETEKLHLE